MMEERQETVTASPQSGRLTTDVPAAAQPTRHVPNSSAGAGRFVLGSLERYGLVIALGVLVLIFAVLPASSPVFLLRANIDNVLAAQAVTGIIAVAMIAPLVCGRFDLTVPASAGFVSVVSADLMANHGVAIPIVLIVGVVLGMVLGLVTALCVSVMKLNAFIVTIGLYTLMQGVAQAYSHSQTVSGLPPSFGNWGSLNWLGVPRPFVLLLVVAVIVWFLLAKTPFGRYLAAIGSNESAARLVGIRVNRAIGLSFVMSGVLAGVAGLLLTSVNGGSNATVAPQYLFPALAAVFLGATTIHPGQYNVWGTMIGVYVVGVAVNGLILVGASSWVQPVFDGGALVVAVALSSFSGRARKRHEAALQRRGADESAERPDWVDA